MAMRSGTPAFSAVSAAFFAAVLPALCAAPAAAQYKVVTSVPAKLSGGTTAFIDARAAARSKRVIEIDYAGRIVWQCSLDVPPFNSAELHRAPDLEWIGADDTFLITVPFRGIFRIDRNCRVVWRYLTGKVSHDADLLPNGNVLHAWAWDVPDDYQAVEIDPSGKTVWRWQARAHVDPKIVAAGSKIPVGTLLPYMPGYVKGEKRVRGGDHGEGFTHTNAVERLPDGDTLISLRNFDRVVRVARSGEIKQYYGPIIRVHDPTFLPDGRLVAANHAPMRIVALGEGKRQLIFANEIDVKPLRTVEPLARGNLLITGTEDIVEIDPAGEVVWHVRIFEPVGAYIRDGIYKAARVRK